MIDPYATEEETQDLLRLGQMIEPLRLAELLEKHPEYTPMFGKAADCLRRLHHNNEVLTNALWKACGDDEQVVNDTIESQGELQ